MLERHAGDIRQDGVHEPLAIVHELSVGDELGEQSVATRHGGQYAMLHVVLGHDVALARQVVVLPDVAYLDHDHPPVRCLGQVGVIVTPSNPRVTGS